MHVGLHYFGKRRAKLKYEKLANEDQKCGRARGGWVKYGRMRGLRIWRSRKISVKMSSYALTLTRIVRVYNEVVKLMDLESVCPAISLRTYWGIPVISHPSLVR